MQQPLHQEAAGQEAFGREDVSSVPEAQPAEGAATGGHSWPDPGATGSSDADPAGRATRLEAELAALKAEHENLSSQYMRLAADFDNFRKRQSRDQDDQRLQITCSTLSEILPVVDNFERARQQLTPQHEEAQNLHRSYQGLYKQLVEVFKQLGVSPMRVEGEPFDPSLHEAVLREESHEHPEDVVIAELQRGYQLNGRVLRHALVKVSMGPGPAEGSGSPAGAEPDGADAQGDGSAGAPPSDS
ncbi:MAG: nucleotide exchange factor GrpE [Cyanobium sp. PLM2.Bin73]|nr:MAG: nucleotide exchange factor GrpE [Cyanobium sp. PLM2.Bin73]